MQVGIEKDGENSEGDEESPSDADGDDGSEEEWETDEDDSDEEATAPDAVDIRVRLSGGREAVARVRPDKVDLSEYGTLAALPEDLRRLAGQLRELKVRSTELEALPAWVGELSRLEVLRVRVKEPWRGETCPIQELPASLRALTGLPTLDL